MPSRGREEGDLGAVGNNTPHSQSLHIHVNISPLATFCWGFMVPKFS